MHKTGLDSKRVTRLAVFSVAPVLLRLALLPFLIFFAYLPAAQAQFEATGPDPYSSPYTPPSFSQSATGAEAGPGAGGQAGEQKKARHQEGQSAQPRYAGDVNNRLSRIENEIETLSRALFRGERPPASSAGARLTDTRQGAAAQADIELRMSGLEADLRALTGKVEKQSYDIQQMRAEIDRLRGLAQAAPAATPGRNSGVSGGGGLVNNVGVGGLQNRDFQATGAPEPVYNSLTPGAGAAGTQAGSLSGRGGASVTAPQASQLLQAPRASLAALPSHDAAASYETAFSLLKRGEYETAERAFQSFLQSYPAHSLSPNAYYWLGESFYVRGNYQEAARTFAEAYQKFPKASKAPDNLLKLGMSLAGMGSEADACVAFDQLVSKYASGSAAILRRAEQEKIGLGCS